jgi:hypothetical protein
MRTERFSWRPALFSLAVCSLVGLQACSSSSGGQHDGGGGGSGGSGGTGGTGGIGGAGGKADGSQGGAVGGGRADGAAVDASSGGGRDGSAGGTGGSAVDGGGADASSGEVGGPATGNPPPGAKKLVPHVLTWYTFQDNTPVNSLFSGSGRLLKPYSSVAVPRRELKANGGTLNYGDKLYIAFLDGRMMPNNTKHTGWVQVDDFCGDAGDDTYCYQMVPEGTFPNVDLYLGDFTKTGMMATATGDCNGPAGSGQELTDVYSGTPTSFQTNYGGATLGSGKCGDKLAARKEQKGTTDPGESGCWGYDGQDSEADCSMCTSSTCAKK